MIKSSHKSAKRKRFLFWRVKKNRPIHIVVYSSKEKRSSLFTLFYHCARHFWTSYSLHFSSQMRPTTYTQTHSHAHTYSRAHSSNIRIKIKFNVVGRIYANINFLGKLNKRLNYGKISVLYMTKSIIWEWTWHFKHTNFKCMVRVNGVFGFSCWRISTTWRCVLVCVCVVVRFFSNVRFIKQ